MGGCGGGGELVQNRETLLFVLFSHFHLLNEGLRMARVAGSLLLLKGGESEGGEGASNNPRQPWVYSALNSTPNLLYLLF